MWYTNYKYQEEVWSKITDYVLTYYGEPIKEAKPLLDIKMIYPEKLTASESGILKILYKRGFFKRKWNPVRWTHYVRTSKEAPKMKLKRDEG